MAYYDYVDKRSLYDFYEHAVLPQFDVTEKTVSWSGTQQAGPDEFIHYYTVDDEEYALVFEDHDGVGRNDDFIRAHVLEGYADYEIIAPTAQSGNTPSYDGFRLPAPYHYCENVTGSFTLIKLLREKI